MSYHLNNSGYIGPDELIYNNDGEIQSGGFSVNSIMLKNGLSPIMTLNHNNINNMQVGGDKVSDLFDNLVIPNWSLSYNYKNGPLYEGGNNFVHKNKDHIHNNHDNNNNDNNTDNTDNDEIIEEELHEKLLNLVKINEKEMKQAAQSNKKMSKKHLKNNTKSKKNVTKKCHKKSNKCI